MAVERQTVGRAALTIFLVSMAGVAYQVALVRLLSVSLWYHFAFLVVSMAVLGFGLSGMLLVFKPKWAEGAAKTVEISATLLAASVATAYLVMATLPFEPFQIGTQPSQVLIGLAYVAAVTAPFFFAGMTAGVLLISLATESGRVYAADLIGAGAGALLTLPAIHLVGGEHALLLGSVLAGAAAVSVRPGPRAGAVLLGAVILTALLPNLLPIRISENKRYQGHSIASIFAGEQRLQTRWNSMSRVDLVEINGTRSLLIDAGVAVTRVPHVRQELDKLKPNHDFTSLGFAMAPQPTVLILGSGGGWETAGAIAHGATRVTAVEINPSINALMLDPQQLAWTKGLFEHPKVDVVTDEARAYLSRSEDNWDVIVSAHTISNSANSTGALNLAENYLMTLEATDAIWRHLSARGVYFVTRPETQIPKLVATLGQTLRNHGLDPRQHVAVFKFGSSGATSFTAGLVLVKDPESLTGFIELAQRYQAAVSHSPKDRLGDPSILKALSQEHGFVLATDNRPFFNMRRDLGDITMADVKRVLVTGDRARLSLEYEPVAEVSLLLLAAMVVVVSGLASLIPILLRRREIEVSSHQGRRSLAYFSTLGVGFMFAELGLVHRLGVFLGSPTVTFAVVVAGLLLSSGVGASISQGLALKRAPQVLVVAAAVLGLLGVLSGSIVAFALTLGEVSRFLVAMSMIAPVGLALGMAFPFGMRAIAAKPTMLAVAWGVNGFASVIGSVVAVMMATSMGFSWLLIAGGGVYLVAAFVFPQAADAAEHDKRGEDGIQHTP